MKLDKQQIAVIGAMGLIVIALVIYSMYAFSGKKKNSDENFAAPEMVQSESKEAYNERVAKKLRTEPEKPKDPVLLNPFADDQQKDSIPVPQPEPKPVPVEEPAPKPVVSKPVVKPVPASSIPKVVQEAPLIQEPEPVSITPDPIRRTKARYNSSVAVGTEQVSSTYIASVYGEQKLYSGSLMKIRLLSPIKLENGITIPRNTFVYGTVAFTGERVKINITSIPYNDVIYHVDYAVFDANDGLEGIYVENMPVNDINKKTGSDVSDEVLTTANTRISTVGGIVQSLGKGVQSGVKKWTAKETVTILDEHRLFLKSKHN